VADTDMLTIRFGQTAAMLFRGHWAIYARRTLYVALALFVLSIVALAATLNSPDEFSIVLGACIALWLLLPLAHVLRPWFCFKAWMKEPNMAGEGEITVDDECLRGKTGQGQCCYEWSMFSLFRERRDLFVLRLGKKQMIVIPKSAFASQDDEARFRGILASKIGVSS